MRVLFVTSFLRKEYKIGGSVISDRNRECLEALFGKEYISVFEVFLKKDTPYFTRFKNRFFKNYIGGVNQKVIDEIIANQNNYDLIFLDSSIYGPIAKELKRSLFRGKVMVFFHNIEYKFNARKGLSYFINSLLAFQRKKAERWAVEYADKVLALTQRDKREINILFPNDKTTIFPSSLKDEYVHNTSSPLNEEMQILFVGSKFRANEIGIKWFVKNVLPYVKAHLTIVGKDMDQLNIEQTEKLKIHGFVNNLSPFYSNAHCVVMPIFEGSGMKTKSTEALMWGKFIVGTREAFEGFELPKDIYRKCDSKECFIQTLTDLEKNRPLKYNPKARETYINKYSFENSTKKMKEIIFSE